LSSFSLLLSQPKSQIRSKSRVNTLVNLSSKDMIISSKFPVPSFAVELFSICEIQLISIL